MKRSLYPREEARWKKLVSKYKYQAMALVIIVVLLLVIGGTHNPTDLEGVYGFQ